MKLKNNKILITGGGSGIGLGLTERFVQEGNQVIICGRRTKVLEKVAQEHNGVFIRSCDLSIEKERIALFTWIKKEHPDLNVLINNAGIQNWMEVTDIDFYKRAKNEIEINLIAPLHLTNLFFGLREIDTIINVSSGLAFFPLLKAPTYGATKAFTHSFTRALRHLVEERGIEVIEIIPPGLDTNLGGKGLHDQFPPVQEFIEAIFKQLQTSDEELTFGYSKNIAEDHKKVTDRAFKNLNSL